MDLVKTYEKLIKKCRDNEIVFQNLNDFKPTFIKFYGTNSHTQYLNKAADILALSMFLEPTVEDINMIESSCGKECTELEMILMELKLLTTRYAKDLRLKRDKKLTDENTKLIIIIIRRRQN